MSVCVRERDRGREIYIRKSACLETERRKRKSEIVNSVGERH